MLRRRQALRGNPVFRLLAAAPPAYQGRPHFQHLWSEDAAACRPGGFVLHRVQALRGDPITVFGDGGQSRSFCYVDDLVEAISRLMLTDDVCTGPINLGNNSEFTILELAEKVINFTNSRSKLVFKPLPLDDPRQRKPDLSKAKTMLDWEPKIALADGLKETVAYFRRSLAMP